MPWLGFIDFLRHYNFRLRNAGGKICKIINDYTYIFPDSLFVMMEW